MSTTKVVTGVVRLSYAHLFEPFAANPDQDPKYSTALLIPKSDTKTIKDLRAAEKVAAEEGKSTKFGGKIPSNLRSLIRDGDEDADLEKNPEYAGHWFMNVRSDRKPVIVDQNVIEVLDPSEVYSGCYAKVSLNAFAYNVSGNKGISFGLNAVQKVRDGEAFGGVKIDPNEVFSVIETDEEDDEDSLV